MIQIVLVVLQLATIFFAVFMAYRTGFNKGVEAATDNCPKCFSIQNSVKTIFTHLYHFSEKELSNVYSRHESGDIEGLSYGWAYIVNWIREADLTGGIIREESPDERVH